MTLKACGSQKNLCPSAKLDLHGRGKMAPRRKRQRLSEDGTDAVTAIVEDAEAAYQDRVEPLTSTAPEKPQSRRSLFVRSLPATTTTETLTELFSQSFPVKHAIAVLEPSTKQCKGYGFVTFADTEDAERAKEEFNGLVFEGHKLKVEIAEPRHRGAAVEAKASLSAGALSKAAREKERAEAKPPKLIIRNLPWSVKKPEHLEKLFQSYGKVKHTTLPTKKPGLLAGFGFVAMRGRKNAEKAMEGINGKEVDGRTLAVDWAVEKDVWQQQAQQANGEVTPNAEADDESAADRPDEIDADVEDQDISKSEMDDVDEEDEQVQDEARVGSEEEDQDEDYPSKAKSDNSGTIFVRNLPFTATDEVLGQHFTQFGPIRYARVVVDPATERSRGTGFVRFANVDDAIACLQGASRLRRVEAQQLNPTTPSQSVLQNADADPTGRYTLEGRVLQITRAVDRSEAVKLTEAGISHRNTRDKDKRRPYLLSEGTIASNSPLYAELSPSEIAMREASAKQRKSLIQSNPSLHLSLTRLSVRNIPRSVTSKDLKALAREAVVGFAKDVKEGKRQKLSKEEVARGGEEMREAERQRKLSGKGVVKQATVVFEGREGGKVTEASGAGRSRGYGFVEYHTHRNALMGLRWLNGYTVDYQTLESKSKGGKMSAEDIQEKKKRLVVEFAIENAQVVGRRRDREVKAKQQKPSKTSGNDDGGKTGKKRKRARDNTADVDGEATEGKEKTKTVVLDEKLAQRQRIIGKKRKQRKERKTGGKA